MVENSRAQISIYPQHQYSDTQLGLLLYLIVRPRYRKNILTMDFFYSVGIIIKDIHNSNWVSEILCQAQIGICALLFSTINKAISLKP